MMIMESLMLNGKGLVAMLWTGWVGCLLWLVGGFDLLVKALMMLMILDYISGLLVGYKQRKLSSKRGFKGLCKKAMIWIIIAGATIASYVIKGYPIREIVATFYVSMELLSIMENATSMGVKIPKKIKKSLEQCNDEGE